MTGQPQVVESVVPEHLRRLPPQAREGLAEAFRSEVSARLPRLQAVADGKATAAELEQARRDAHTLGSSATVLGEPSAAQCARALEVELAGGGSAQVAPLVRRLHELLAGWLS